MTTSLVRSHSALRLLMEAVCGPLVILPLIVLGGALWDPYTPQEITELQEVPYILQAGTDWGRSNIEAYTIVLLFFFGTTASLYLAYHLQSGASFSSALRYGSRRLALHFALFGALYAFFLHGSSSDYFVCESFGIHTVALSAYLGSLFFNVALSATSLPHPIRMLLSPLPIALWFFLSLDGVTFKAGQVVVSGEIPKPSTRSWRHSLVTLPQRFCPRVIYRFE